MKSNKKPVCARTSRLRILQTKCITAALKATCITVLQHQACKKRESLVEAHLEKKLPERWIKISSLITMMASLLRR